MLSYRTTSAKALIVLLGVCSSFGVPVAAEPQAKKQASEEKICRRPVADVSSRIPPKKDCRTKAEWAEEAQLSQQVWQRRPQSPSTPR